MRRLCKRTDIQLTITVGRDRTLRKEIESEIKTPAHPVEILGWSNRMPELLMSHHLVITKAGGATVQEAIAARTPVIISQVVPGQEEGNARLIAEGNAGVIAVTPEAIAQAVRSVFDPGGETWQRWRDGVRRLSRPNASREIADWILSLK